MPIRISELTERHIGRIVYYQNNSEIEFGIVTSWNESYVFVRFVKSWSVACNPIDLEWAVIDRIANEPPKPFRDIELDD